SGSAVPPGLGERRCGSAGSVTAAAARGGRGQRGRGPGGTSARRVVTARPLLVGDGNRADFARRRGVTPPRSRPGDAPRAGRYAVRTASIASTSSAVSAGAASAATLLSSWRTLLAPTSAEVTRS